MARTQEHGPRVAVLGLGREGTALARYLARKGYQVTVSDLGTEAELAPSLMALRGLEIEYALGGHPNSLLEADALYVSPGVPFDAPILEAARGRGVPLETETRLFFRLCPAPIVGITGSSGKTTTALLAGAMLQETGARTWVGGNIGDPLIERVDEIAAEDAVVLELSSFQLQGLEASPHIACVLNIHPDHLDRHPTMADYIEAKWNILKHQGPEDLAVLNRDDPLTFDWTGGPRRVLAFSRRYPVEEGAELKDGTIWLRLPSGDASICRTEEFRLRGEHNLSNLLAAVAVAASAGAEPQAIARAARAFRGAPHRLESLGEAEGVLFVNDSIATSPSRAVSALRSLDRPIVLLAGGRSKDLPLEDLALHIVERVRHLILFGESAGKLRAAVNDAMRLWGGEGLSISEAADLEEAVRLAVADARPGEAVLLAPGHTSFDAYRNFEERGAHFRSLVAQMAGVGEGSGL
ncbi:MAG: UDP-N-acetylmuramoyl-L-alanine--D-glutamate ligase [Anaerolineae bacterium]